MLVWAALFFNEEILQPAFDSGRIVFPPDVCTAFFANINGAIEEAKVHLDPEGGISAIWIAQVEIEQEDLLASLNDFSFNAGSYKLTGPNDDFPGIRATIKQKLLYKG